MMDDLETLREFGKPEVDLVFEDDRALVAVGVDELHVALGGAERGLQDGEHRGDAATPAKQYDPVLALVRAQREAPLGWLHQNPVSDVHLVVEPVGNAPVIDAFDRHLGPGIGPGRARKRVATMQLHPFPGNLEGEELPGPIAELFLQ